MEQNKVLELLEQLKRDPKAQEALRQAAKAQNPKEAVPLLTALAKDQGCTVSEADMWAAIQAAEGQRKEQTEEAAAQVERLSDDEIAKAAGAGDLVEHSNCKDTFKDYENCWINDGCDKNYQDYDDYICARDYNGNHSRGHCQEIWLCNTPPFW